MSQRQLIRAGLDVGSTTAKIVLLDAEDQIVFSEYQRHHARVYETVGNYMAAIREKLGNPQLNLRMTGSAALGVSKELKLPFVQEMVATHTVVDRLYPDVNTVMDIGGEDSKIIFLSRDHVPDIRMNGSCAGGTGSFIDQVATLLGITPFQLDSLAKEYRHIYPVASRCGVFAKTDVQNMLARNVSHADIAASVFHAMAVQCVNSLARGIRIRPKMVLCGGVFTFLPELVKAFLRILDFDQNDIVLPDRPELMTAMGAALSEKGEDRPISVEELSELLTARGQSRHQAEDRLEPLFENTDQFEQWKQQSRPVALATKDPGSYEGTHVFLGVDSGSTTTKIVILGENDEVLFSWYADNKGNPVNAVVEGLKAFRQMLQERERHVDIVKTAVTGYGEDLIRAAFNMDLGIVETIAHFTAARFIDPQVSFILDIGGQDMKAIFIDQGVISRIELNEACSSGCGSFLQTLAASVERGIEEFANLACESRAPCDLGTRCTVFMNSKIKQSLRENASVADISAGLSYSVIKNCLFKVLKLQDMSQMGDHIVLQGGTFKNPAIVRAMELLSQRSVSVSRSPELMGAFGAALSAKKLFVKNPAGLSSFSGLSALEKINQYRTKQVTCKGCENRCTVTRFDFTGGQAFYSGNKCEAFFTARGEKFKKGFDFAAFKRELLFNRDLAPHKRPVVTLGIPKSLNFYENFIFWHALFTRCDINLTVSSTSTVPLSEKGMGSVMSDNICFPAKLVHGHIYDLAEKKPDRIFYPVVMYETREFERTANTYNCPIVSSYPDVIESAVHPEEQFGIPLDRPIINFGDLTLLKRSCIKYLKQLGISRKKSKKAFDQAWKDFEAYKSVLLKKAEELIENAQKEKSLLIVLAGRPYHIDPLINHKIPDVLTGFGADIITEDALPVKDEYLDKIHVVTQWAYPNRIYSAARWVALQPDNIQMVQLNSFGCGPDAVVIEEVKSILKTGDKNHTLIRVDEISSPGSVRLRLRSLIESLKEKQQQSQKAPSKGYVRKPFPRFGEEDRKRTIWAPYFSEDYSAYLPPMFKSLGYDLQILPEPDRKSVELGLRYANNDICYPGTIVIGDIIKALKNRRYSAKDIAVGITQTGGQCRASNYLALIRKAMEGAGYGDIPIISVTASQGLVDQPGFYINWLKNINTLYVITMFADCIAKMYYATACRETVKGAAQKLRQSYMKKAAGPILVKDTKALLKLLEEAIGQFNQIPVHLKDMPRMGVVGEIYAKYNYFSNQDLVHWLMKQGVEPVLPPIVDYFIQDLVNYKENIKAGIRKRKWLDLLGLPIEWYVQASHKKINALFSKFRFYTPFEDIREVAEYASDLVSMVNQFGEGWLIPGEIAAFAGQGVNHVISCQPFGCIANHIVSKGVEKRIRQLYPKMNLYFLDFDSGMSEANVRNRLHFMVEHL